ncbi:MarR family winged helix-turn-helix transcriptional regulator [Deinococcus hopiensis]|uniref:DNA-binding transcriptional regulator, MarR family n=1 Tax=Deinococcus hopiensis KR-140 TaxID=695939 RepID=A0A1W1UTX2_9DEIO|nr:MarR family transcriptional regulator [Deinococcus hopiensis]SMB84164.1 DNA-binding transcriptional regulator, MarR family [Deinococcus hopiensis KR-140]
MTESASYLLHRLVFELDRAADRLLRSHFGISYSRALFLFMLQHHGTVTQHELATALGYSDPAISTMLKGLIQDGYVQVVPSPEHARKRLVSLTPQGSHFVAQGRKLLDGKFDELMTQAGVDLQHYADLTQRLNQALVGQRSPDE